MCALLGIACSHRGTLLHNLLEFVGYITKVLHGHLSYSEIYNSEDDANGQSEDEEYCTTNEQQHLLQRALILRAQGCNCAVTTMPVNLQTSLLLNCMLVCLSACDRDM